MKPNYFRLFVQAVIGVTAFTLAVAYAVICSYVYLEPSLPSVTAMKNNELAVPLRVYTRSGDLIAQIGEQRRNPVAPSPFGKLASTGYPAESASFVSGVSFNLTSR